MTRPKGVVIPFSEGRSSLLDSLSFEIIMSIYDFDPHNERQIAEHLGVDPYFLRRRINALKARGYLRVTAIPNLHRLGLIPHLLLIKAPALTLASLASLFMSSPYWRYITRSYSGSLIYLVKMGIPKDKVHAFEEFLGRLVSEGVFERVAVIRTSNPFYVKPSLVYYDSIRGMWRLDFDAWIADILEAEGNSLDTDIIWASSPTADFDMLDLELLERLEADGLRPLYRIAQQIGCSASMVYYHYLKHVVGRGLLLKYVPLVYPFRFNLSYTLLSLLKVKSLRSLKMIFEGSLGKPFIVNMLTSLNRRILILVCYLPRSMLLHFYNAVERLRDSGIVSSYKILLIDTIQGTYRQSIPYAKIYDEKDRKWAELNWWNETVERLVKAVKRKR